MDSKFKRGDKVKITGMPCNMDCKEYINTIGTIEEVDTDNTAYIKCCDGDSWWFHIRDFVMSNEDDLFHVGDKVRVVALPEIESVKPYVNTIGEIIQVDGVCKTLTYLVEFGDGTHWWVGKDDITLVEDENKDTDTEDTKNFKIGDIVTTIPDSDYRITRSESGWVGKIDDIDDDYSNCITLKSNDGRFKGVKFLIHNVDLVHSDYVPVEETPKEEPKSESEPNHTFCVGDSVLTTSPIFKGVGTIVRIMRTITDNLSYLVDFGNNSTAVFLEGELKYLPIPDSKKDDEKSDDIKVAPPTTTITMDKDGKITISDTKEAVNHPNHYQIGGKYEVLDVMRDTSTREEYEGFLRNNVLKYILRYKNKNGIEDLKKARFYLDELIKILDTPTC